MLGVGESTVWRRLADGTLPRHGGARERHPVRLSDIAALLSESRRQLTVRVAAQRLEISVSVVQKLCGDGQLEVTHRRGRWPTVDVERLRQLLEAGATTDPAQVDRIPATAAAQILGVTPKWVAVLARQDRLPAIKDAAGHWWFRRDQLERIVAARVAQQARTTAGRPPAT